MKEIRTNRGEQLGMSSGKARGILVKKLLFHLVCETGRAICARCGEPIEDYDDLTIDHITPWLHSTDPVGLYFDVDNNIAFSHSACNRAHARKLNYRGTVELVCSGCGQPFSRSRCDYDAKVARGQDKFYCRRDCFSATYGYVELRADEVLEIRRRFSEGESTRKIAADYGKSHVAIHSCVTRKSYKHIA